MSNTEGRINRIEDKIARTMEECGMLPEHGKFIVGLSGGADSMCLAHYLSRRFSVLAAHVNHGLRGEEADADERSAECWCRQNNVPFCAERADVAALSRETGKSGRMAAAVTDASFARGILRAVQEASKQYD